ncbi:hypothetical protein L6452_26311 [Arctium lappa]|uniref:Uncharacterized protein n=1 Tax=Arctium lappa TaxID=4217 RepID=A0ACB9ACU1_ARCLA|nr:hypothetical protein L6452_26311 [Arctium lappa]
MVCQTRPAHDRPNVSLSYLRAPLPLTRSQDCSRLSPLYYVIARISVLIASISLNFFHLLTHNQSADCFPKSIDLLDCS